MDTAHPSLGLGASCPQTPRHTDRLSGRVRRRPAESSNGRRCRVGTSTAGRVTASVRCYPRRRSRAPPGGDGARRPRPRCRRRCDPNPYPSSQGSSTTSPVACGCSPPTPTNSQRALHPTPTGRQRGDQRSLTESRSLFGPPPRWPRPVTPRMTWAAHSTTPTSSWPTWPPPNPTAPTNRGQTRRPTPRAPSESQARALATVGQKQWPPAGTPRATSGQVYGRQWAEIDVP